MSTAVAQYAANTDDTGGGWVGGSGAGGSPADAAADTKQTGD